MPLPWPHGVHTLPEFDPRRNGTKPAAFAADRARLEQAIERFIAATGQARWARHPLFGALSEAEWLRWGYLHADHHLRQFGV